ncbi:hypothetical protein DDB_G0281995 [Dictyostelium discoideum AX4]|uniref:Uncharacterized protein n=1 Tax=Dictyostelium discoideum TaxID=44689 RepID=Q54T54_DICDI|nr:hypothetical protein DDB_G0281995 [Dictyostelium discoideum AX4]EAL66419.1 hypothetical protein DDB_G0281995 [Dictyostelium discoideum AX4]|eukprot:XP_640397.1 hypothetical protein DDB_G0281995 [Dictyostelium discoideum AX4]
MGNMFPGLSNKKKATIISLNAELGLNDKTIKNFSRSLNNNAVTVTNVQPPSLFV